MKADMGCSFDFCFDNVLNFRDMATLDLEWNFLMIQKDEQKQTSSDIAPLKRIHFFIT